MNATQISLAITSRLNAFKPLSAQPIQTNHFDKLKLFEIHIISISFMNERYFRTVCSTELLMQDKTLKLFLCLVMCSLILAD